VIDSLVLEEGAPGKQLLADLRTLVTLAASAPEQAAPELEAGETRRCAILYLDVKGYTELSRLLTSEQLAVLIDRVFKLLTLEVEREGGYLDKVVGDAALYVFPGSEAHPPVVEASLRAASRIQERLGEVNEALSAHRVSLSVRIGVNYGEVTRLTVGGTGQPETVMGEAVNLAQRLESACPPGSVLTTKRVASYAPADFVFSPPRPVELKGFGQVEVVELLSCPLISDRLRIHAGERLAPFVGRKEELARLLEEISRPGPPMPLVTLTGDPAVGKSRLIFEALRRLPEEDRGRVVVQTPSPPVEWLAVGREMARSLIRELGRLVGELSYQQVASLLSPEDPSAERIRFGLSYLLEQGEEAERVAKLDVETRLELAEIALSALIGGISSRLPEGLVMVLEDLQWADQGSSALLARLIRSLRQRDNLSLVLTGRTGTDFPLPSGLRPDYELFLSPLSPQEGRELVRLMLPGADLSPSLIEQIVERSAGVPFFVEEFCLFLEQEGYVERQGDRFRLVRSVEHLSLPDEVEQMVLARLDRLDSELRSLVRRLAVLGRSFPTQLVMALEGRVGRLTPDQLRDALSRLASQGILVEEEEGQRYSFRHLVTMEAAYKTNLTTNKLKLHRLAAECLEELYPERSAARAENLPRIIRHLLEAELKIEALKRALELLRLAGNLGSVGDFDAYRDLAERLLNEISWENYTEEWASELSPPTDYWLPPDEFPYLSRLPLPEGGSLIREHYALELAVAECAFHWRRGEAQRYEQAVWLLMSHPLVEADPRLFTTLSVIASNMELRQARPRKAAALIEGALSRARATGDPRLMGDMHTQLGLIRWQEGDLKEAERYFRNAIDYYRRADDPIRVGAVLANLAQVRAEQQYYEDALRLYEEAHELHRRYGMRRSEAIALGNLATIHYQMGRLTEAKLQLEKALEIHRELQNRPFEAMTLGNIALVLQQLGEYQEAERYYYEALRINRELGNKRSEGVVLSNLAGLKRRQGQLDDALSYYREAEMLLNEVGHWRFLSEVLTFTADLEIEMGDLKRAREALSQARAVNEHVMKASLGVAWLAISGRLALRHGDLDEALRFYQQAVELAEKLKLGAGVDYAEPLHRLRGELIQKGVKKSLLPLPDQWSEEMSPQQSPTGTSP